jgi:uncharacterized membrane protein
MEKTRLEAFSDGVIAIIITIMVLEMKAPEGADWVTIKPMVPKFLSYVLSFLFVAIYWVNHHHLLHTVKRVTASIMWANVNLLFWLSLVPFATAWMGENHFERVTVAVYAVLALFCGLSYSILNRNIARHYSEATRSKLALKKNTWKTIAAITLYSAAIPIALFVNPAISGFLFLAVSVIWLIPDSSVERALEKNDKNE